MRSRLAVVGAALAVLLVPAAPAEARNPIRTILHAPYALLSALSGHHTRHALRRHRHEAATASRAAIGPTMAAHPPSGQDARRQPIMLGAAAP